MARTGTVVAAIGQDGFAPALTSLLQAVAPYTYTVVFGYSGSARPLDLYDDFPASKQRIFVTDYQEGPYLLDPFYLAVTRPVSAGLYRMRDLAPDRFYQGEYFRNYYIQTGLAEEIGFFVDFPDGAMVILSLMRDERPFSTREMKGLAEVQPLIAASIRRHWADLSSRFTNASRDRNGPAKETDLERSFHSFGDGILTAREREIVEHTLKGHSADAVGRILAISPGTVRIHRRNIYAKLRISSQGELFSLFIQTLATPDGRKRDNVTLRDWPSSPRGGGAGETKTLRVERCDEEIHDTNDTVLTRSSRPTDPRKARTGRDPRPR